MCLGVWLSKGVQAIIDQFKYLQHTIKVSGYRLRNYKEKHSALRPIYAAGNTNEYVITNKTSKNQKLEAQGTRTLSRCELDHEIKS